MLRLWRCLLWLVGVGGWWQREVLLVIQLVGERWLRESGWMVHSSIPLPRGANWDWLHNSLPVGGVGGCVLGEGSGGVLGGRLNLLSLLLLLLSPSSGSL